MFLCPGVRLAERFILRSLDLFFFQAEDGIRDRTVTGVQTCALPISAEGARPTERTRVDHCDGPARLTAPRRHPGRDAGPDNDEIVMSFHRRLLLQLRRTAPPERPERCDRLSHFPALSLDQV